MHLAASLAAMLPLTAIAGPLTARAGGPPGKPIPSNCTVDSPLLHAACGAPGVTTTGCMPYLNFITAHKLYRSHVESFATTDHAVQLEWKRCIESCYGYGTPGSCKSAILTYDRQTPADVLYSTCILFNDYLTKNDLETVEPWRYFGPEAGSIRC